MRVAYWYAAGFVCLLAACGEEKGPAIQLHQLNKSPSCFDKPELETVEGVTEEEIQRATARRELLAAQIDFAFEEAELLSGPVRDQPEAESWSEPIEGGTLEGSALARGEGWSVIKMIAIYEDFDGPTSRDAIIDSSPRRTLFDFGDRELELRDELFRLDSYVRGCDPNSEVSFEVGPAFVGTTFEENVLRCWPQPMIPADASEETRNTLIAQHNDMCLETASALLTR